MSNRTPLHTTFALLAILALVGGAAYFLRPKAQVNPWDSPTPILQGDTRLPLLETLGLDIHRLTRIQLAPQGKTPLVFVRDGDQWMLKEPTVLALKADPFAGLILAPLRETKKFGLAESAPAPTGGTIELTGDTATARLRLGPNLGAGTGLLDVNNQHLRVSSNLHDLLENLPALAALANPQLDLPPLADLDQISIQTPRGKTELHLLKTGWGMGKQRASVDAVKTYYAALQNLSIAEIPTEELSQKELGLDQPTLQFTLHGTHQTTRLEIGGPTGPTASHYFLRLAQGQAKPLIATVETAQIGALAQGENFFLDTRLVAMKMAEARQLRVCPAVLGGEGAPTLHLAKDAGGQLRFGGSPPAFSLDNTLAKTSFEALFNLRPVQTGPAIADPAYRLTLTDAFGREEKFVVGRVKNGTRAIARMGDTGSFLVPEAQVAPLLATATDLKEREIHWMQKDGEIAEINLNAFHFIKHDGQWTSQDGSAFDEPSVLALEQWLKNPSVAKWVNAAKDFAPTLHLDVANKDGRHLRLGMNTAGLGSLCLPDGATALVMMPPACINLLTGEFRPRQLISLNPAQISFIEIKRGDKNIRISRNANGLFAANGTSATQAQCAMLFDTLGGLRAEKPAPPAATAPKAQVTLQSANGETRHLDIFENSARFTDHGQQTKDARWFVWDATSEQAKAVQALLK